ncbi:septation protein IspZ [endosymbiont of Acanthamoeba sp. UWC8]|uniref:septation protein IspZ n=1 Tax=endosymbiont of Acanthamoeba sp. UWC8 TaxID=86106 RepID=UPI00057197B0|nr:septation protein IspZ [endosymbiont of Acanthamoeba sp. UWC8]
MQKLIEKLCDFLPLLVFIIAYYKSDIVTATTCLIIASLLSLSVVYIIKRKLPKIMVFSNIILIIFGGITVFSGDSTFIKIKPTILYLSFASILIYDLIAKKALLKHLFGQAFELDDKTYLNLSKQWLVFFITCAVLNEVIWRNFSERTWVSFKTFGVLGLTFVFTLLQVVALQKKSKTNIK